MKRNAENKPQRNPPGRRKAARLVRSVWSFWPSIQCTSQDETSQDETSQDETSQDERSQDKKTPAAPRTDGSGCSERVARETRREKRHGLLVSLIVVVGLTVAFPSISLADDLPSVNDVTDKLDKLYRSNSSHSEMTMEINTAHWSRTLEMESWTKGEDLGVVVIRSPAKEAGTATLRNEEGLWNYAPRADRLMRIPSGMLSDGWMGSHFTNDDLMRESSWNDDYDSTVAWDELDGDKVLKIVSIPKPDSSVVYSRVVNYLTADGWLPLRAEYYDDEEMVRTMSFSSVKTLDGRKIPTVMKLVPTDKPDESTTVVYDDAEFDLSLKDSLFTARGLRKKAQR